MTFAYYAFWTLAVLAGLVGFWWLGSELHAVRGLLEVIARGGK